ncbi:MAG: hypothetical protein HY782_27820 [Chloroflexi bacterium]|nr:hypothetical protein [Chloroflexota bacterium]
MTKIYNVAEARRLLGSLAQDLARLEQIAPRTLAEYEAQWDKVAIIERLFTRLVNYATDINWQDREGSTWSWCKQLRNA